MKNDKGLSSEQINTLKKILEEEAEKCVGEVRVSDHLTLYFDIF